MRVLTAVALVVATFSVACGSGTSSPTAPTPPAGGQSGATTLTGTWAGSASDSTGSMMGSGMTGSMMGNMTWTIVQTGNTFTGTMQFPGYMGGGGQMAVSGTINGSTATFTMTMPSGSMMAGSVTCTATATGTFDFDALMTQMHGSYGGTNSCSGPFNQGQMTMTRR